MRTIAPLLLFFFSIISMKAQQATDTLSIPEKFNLIYKTSSSYQEYKIIGKIRFQQLRKEVSDSLQSLKSEIQSKNQRIEIQKDNIQEAKEVAKIIGRNYQQMMVQKNSMQFLRKEVSDSLQSLKSEIQSKNRRIEIQKDSIQKAKEVAEIIGRDYQQMIVQKNSMQFLGIEFTKSTYNLMVWFLIGVLLILLFYLIYRFKNNNIIAIKSNRELRELEEEFAIHKKKYLEREQKIRRQLQDEINKQRGV